jgi:hypothetical protein
VPLKAYANALVVPYAGVDVDAYVGAGFDFGIGGASVGINGQITLIQVDVPVGGGIELRVRKVGQESLSARPWPKELTTLGAPANGVAIPLNKFQLELVGNAQAGIIFRALDGEVSLALRVRLLFFKKTWRKKLASFEGFSKRISWVGDFKIPIGEPLPVPGLDKLPIPAIGGPEPGFGRLQMPQPGYGVLPALPFPNVAALTRNQFPALDLNIGTSIVPENIDLTGLSNLMLSKADFFKNGWDPRQLNVDPWLLRKEYPKDGVTGQVITGALNTLNAAVGNTEFQGVPANCQLTQDIPPVVPQ